MPTLSTFTRILVGVDYSETSERALALAVDLSKVFEASLHVVHVYPSVLNIAPPLVAGPVFAGELRDRNERAFSEYLVKAKARFGKEMSGTLCDGVPDVEILRAASEVGADLVVLGTHGRTGLDRFLMGSVAQRVLQRCPVPVMTVPKATD